MPRHLDAYELSRCRSGSKAGLFDLDYIEEHLKTCRLCQSRLKLPKLGEIAKREILPPNKLPEPGHTAGGIYWPVFDDSIHKTPDGWQPVAALTDPETDPDTGLKVLDIANLHETLGMEGSNDILLEESEGRFWGWYLALWSRRTVLASALELDKPLGMLVASTMTIVEKIELGEELSEEEYNRTGIGEPEDILDPLYHYRQRLMLDFQTLSGDLFSRSAFVMEHAGLFAERLERDVFNGDGAFMGFDEICRIFTKQYAEAKGMALEGEAWKTGNFMDEPEFKNILAQCEGTDNIDALLVLSSYHGHLYIQTGLPEHREKGWALIDRVFPQPKLSFKERNYGPFTGVIQRIPGTETKEGDLLNPRRRIAAGDQKEMQTRCFITDRSISALLVDIENDEQDISHLAWDTLDCTGYDRSIQKGGKSDVLWSWQMEAGSPKVDLSQDYAALVLDMDSGAFLGEAAIEIQDGLILITLQEVCLDTLPEQPVSDPSRCCILIGKKDE